MSNITVLDSYFNLTVNLTSLTRVNTIYYDFFLSFGHPVDL